MFPISKVLRLVHGATLTIAGCPNGGPSDDADTCSEPEPISGCIVDRVLPLSSSSHWISLAAGSNVQLVDRQVPLDWKLQNCCLGVEHKFPQIPLLHATVVPEGTTTEHAIPQPPQFLVSVCRFAHVVGLFAGQAVVVTLTRCAQVPSATWFVACAQLMHPVAESGHAVAQQTLSTQNPLVH